LISNDHHIRLERAGAGLFGVLGDLHHELGATDEALDIMRVYVDEHLLVTMRRHPLKSTDAVRRDLTDGLRFGTTAALFNHLLSPIGDSISAFLAQIDDWVDDAEEHVLVSDAAIDSRKLGRMRRLLARMRRHMPSMRTIDLPGLLGGWCGKAEAA